jgi:hypothetical protein
VQVRELRIFFVHPEVLLNVGMSERKVFGREIVDSNDTYLVTDTLSFASLQIIGIFLLKNTEPVKVLYY